MEKYKFAYVTVCIGFILLFFSWYSSYPISINSMHDYEYYQISFLYWLSLPILFASFFIIAIKTKNKYIRYIVTIMTVFLMLSTTYFRYMVFGSDAHQFIGLTEYYLSNEKINPTPLQNYYQWPIFFILNKIIITILGLDLRYAHFILYSIVTFVITTLIYIYMTNYAKNGYFGVISFFIIFTQFQEYQLSPYILSLIPLLVLIYLNKVYEQKETIIIIVTIFYTMTYTHILVPLLYILYIFSMYVIERKKVYLNIFLLTLSIYILVFSNNILFTGYIVKMNNLFYMELQRQIGRIIISSAAQKNNTAVIAQFFSRTVTILTVIVTGLGYMSFFMRRKFERTDYGMLLSGIIFLPTLLISFATYKQIFWRGFLLLCIPFSLGSSHLYESKFKKYFKIVFFILLISFTFTIAHKSFYDRFVFTLTNKESHYTNFMIDNINWDVMNRFYTDFFYGRYLRSKISSERVRIISDFGDFFTEEIKNYKYVTYTVGLAKTFFRFDVIERAFTLIDKNHSNLICSAGNYYYIFSH